MSQTTYAVKGLGDVFDALTLLSRKIETQAVKSGLTAAAAVVRDEARERLIPHRKSGLTAAAIKSGSPRKNQDGSYQISVRLTGRGGFVGTFLEYGVAPHLIKARTSDRFEASIRTLNKRAKAGDLEYEKGKRRGSLRIGHKWISGTLFHPGFAPKPFLRPALDYATKEAVEAFRLKILAVVEGKTGFNAGLDEAA